MRILFATTAGTGHFAPLLPWLDACVARSHEVLVVGPDTMADQLTRTGYPHRLGASPAPEDQQRLWQHVMTLDKDQAAAFVMGEIFCRLNSGTLLPGMRQAYDEFAPDLVLRDPAESASAVAAAERGIRQARVAIALAGFDDAQTALADDVLDGFLPGLPQLIRRSTYLTPFPPTLDPPRYPDTRRYHSAGKAPRPLPDWWDGRTDPLVYLTFGTEAPRMPDMHSAYSVALRALRGLPLRVLLTIGRDLDPAVLGEVPGTVHVERWVDQADVLAVADAVISHGGSGTVLGTLAAGLPHVVLPLFADQGINAQRLAEVGAGIAVTAADPGPRHVPGPDDEPKLRAALETVLADDGYARTAARLAGEMAAAPTPDELLDALLAE